MHRIAAVREFAGSGLAGNSAVRVRWLLERHRAAMN
jgi:hypothetical protein